MKWKEKREGKCKKQERRTEWREDKRREEKEWERREIKNNKEERVRECERWTLSFTDITSDR